MKKTYSGWRDITSHPLNEKQVGELRLYGREGYIGRIGVHSSEWGKKTMWYARIRGLDTLATLLEATDFDSATAEATSAAILKLEEFLAALKRERKQE